jgi:hypothetical protein
MPSDQFNQTQQGLGGMAGLFGSMGSQLYGQGQQAMQFDPTAMQNQYLANMRAQAQPYQQQAFNMFQNSAFNNGQLGSTAGAANLKAFQDSMNSQDLGFQNAAFGLGQSQQQIQNQLGTNLMGMGQGLFGQSAGLNQQMLGNAMNFNQQGLQNYGSALGMGNGLFGMGNQLSQQNITNAMTGLQGQQSMDQMLQSMMQTGGQFGNAGAQAGARAGGFMTSPGATQNPFGALLSGVGAGMAGTNPMGGLMNWAQNKWGNNGYLDPNQYGISPNVQLQPMPSFPG